MYNDVPDNMAGHMATGRDSDRPIRVVVFGSGPLLEYGFKRFLCRLEDHAEIEFTAAVIQAPARDARAVWRDLWRRRGLLALPVLLRQWLRSAGRYLKQGQREAALERCVGQLAERIWYVTDMHSPDVLARIRRLVPDLGLSYGSPILKPELFQIPRFGTLGIHHGQLPAYRGKKTTFWAMYNGERTAGVTIQKINTGLDTGEIVVQGEVEIGKRSFSTVWSELEAVGLDIYIEAITAVKAGTASFARPAQPKGKLYKDPKLRDILTLWRRQLMQRVGYDSGR